MTTRHGGGGISSRYEINGRKKTLHEQIKGLSCYPPAALPGTQQEETQQIPGLQEGGAAEYTSRAERTSDPIRSQLRHGAPESRMIEPDQFI